MLIPAEGGLNGETDRFAAGLGMAPRSAEGSLAINREAKPGSRMPAVWLDVVRESRLRKA